MPNIGILFLNLRNLYHMHAIKFEIQWSKRFSGTFLKANIENARLALARFLLDFCNGRLTVGNQSNFGVTRPDLNFSFFTTMLIIRIMQITSLSMCDTITAI